MQPLKTLEELEKIYARDKNLQNKPDLNFDKLKISKEELDTKPKLAQTENATEPNFPFYNGDQPIVSKKQDEFIELKTFLPTNPEKMISTRYENPLNQLKVSTKRWKIFTVFLCIFSFGYFLLNLWATLALSNLQVFSEAPKAILQVTSLLLQMEDLLFYNYTLNIIMDVWALLIFVVLVFILIKETFSKVDVNIEEQTSWSEKTVPRVLKWFVILFGMSYIIGTIFVLHVMHSQANARDMAPLVIFHLSKLLYFLMNVIAFKKYKTTKFIYEDLLLEALGTSGSGDEKSEMEENNEHYNQNTYPSEI